MLCPLLAPAARVLYQRWRSILPLHWIRSTRRIRLVLFHPNPYHRAFTALISFYVRLLPINLYVYSPGRCWDQGTPYAWHCFFGSTWNQHGNWANPYHRVCTAPFSLISSLLCTFTLIASNQSVCVDSRHDVICYDTVFTVRPERARNASQLLPHTMHFTECFFCFDCYHLPVRPFACRCCDPRHRIPSIEALLSCSILDQHGGIPIPLPSCVFTAAFSLQLMSSSPSHLPVWYDRSAVLQLVR
jgi:hypothetical protein